LARLYANENFPLPVVVQLRDLGHDVLTTQDAGKSNQAIEDDEVLRFASSQGRGVVTLNRKHFVRLHLAGTQHTGIIVCTYDPDFVGQAHRIHDALQNAGDLTGILIRINRLG